MPPSSRWMGMTAFHWHQLEMLTVRCWDILSKYSSWVGSWQCLQTMLECWVSHWHRHSHRPSQIPPRVFLFLHATNNNNKLNNLIQGVATTVGRVMATATVVPHHAWLCFPAIPKSDWDHLLWAPFSKVTLFILPSSKDFRPILDIHFSFFF